MRVNELVAAPPPPRRCCHCTHAGARREGGRRRARYVYDTKGERGTMTITVLVDWRAMNNLGTMCAAAADTRAACRAAGQWAGKSREERREKEREEGRDSRLPQDKLQILGDVSGGEMRVDMDAGRETRKDLSLSRTRLFACRHRCVCVLFRGPGEREQRERERVGRRRDRQRAGRRGERRAARASSRSFHGNFYQIFTIIPSGLDSAVRRHGEKERKRETAPSYTTGEL